MDISAKSKGKPLRVKKARELVFDNDSLQQGADFGDQKLDRLCVIRTSFVNCRFDNIVVRNATCGEGTHVSTFTDCSFDGVDIKRFSPGVARFVRCKFTNANIKDLFSLSSDFVDCIFSGKLTKCVFDATVPESDQASFGRKTNEFSGNNFEGAVFNDVGFRGGIDLANQKLPLDDSYILIPDGIGFIKNVRAKYLSESDKNLREDVFGMIRFLEYDVNQGQHQLYFSNDEIPEKARDAVLSLL